jgi:hypothetical protein
MLVATISFLKYDFNDTDPGECFIPGKWWIRTEKLFSLSFVDLALSQIRNNPYDGPSRTGVPPMK